MDLPETSAALILHADGRIELALPKADGNDEVPEHVILCAALATIANDETRASEEVGRFIALSAEDKNKH